MATASFSDRTRSYQQEMFERSMEGNRIIVMDTGSGKTQVAMLRIQAELDRCATEKRIWFLVPSVQLCIQQHTVLQQALPAYKMRLLTGQDNVDKWSELSIWEAALDQARVIVSTHAVLSDALRHGFVPLTSLALLVFDEAHHCIKKDPANIIMRDFYHEIKATGTSVPHILGLSASLIMSSSLSSVSRIEANLDSVSVTPRLQRQDLMRNVFRPECRILRYGVSDMSDESMSQGLQALRLAIVQHASSCTTVAAPNTLKRTEMRDVQRTLQKFSETAKHILVELGACAADFFIRETVTFLRTKSSSSQDLQLDMADTAVNTLLALFNAARIEQACQQEGMRFSRISAKAQCLLDYLLQNPGSDLCGIVFVNQRVVASVLSSLLNGHPTAHGRLRCVPSVGTSNFSGRKFAITELVDRRSQKQALATFRQGQANIIVATSVLEEGIDVQACNVVACFDLPANLKSYIQRRGRARHQHSRYGMLLGMNADSSKVARWHELEDELTALCQKERQQAEVYRRIEAEDETIDYILRGESTGAKLDVDSTLQHLHHFCQLLQRDPCNDPRPIFSFYEDQEGGIGASVALPHSIPAHVRHASSKRTWRTEKAAKKDAAFHAYAALFEAGLLNDHLLPISQEWNVNEGLEEAAPPARLKIESSDLWARSKSGNDWYKLEIQIIPPATLCPDHEPPVHVVLNTYQRPSTPPTLKLYWDRQTSFEAQFGRSTPSRKPSPADVGMMHSFTSALYRAPRSKHHWQVDNELLTLFEPSKDEAWLHDIAECPADQCRGKQLKHLVRVASRDNTPYLFHQWTQHDEVVCTRLPKKRNFSIPAEPKLAIEQDVKTDSFDFQQQRKEAFPLHDCTIGSVAVAWARVGLFMPDILQHLHDFTLVDELTTNLLHDVNLLNRNYIRSAITTPSAQRPSNYQRSEFLGDCLLKYVTSCHLFNTYPNWPEGYLSQRRSLLVCNATLACAAIRTGLSRYIISEPVDYRYWTLPSTTFPQHSREVSSKSLADVVEALIGVAWLEAGIEAARRCINVFLPAMPTSLQQHDLTTSSGRLSGKLKQVEALIGYQFSNPTLLSQALTHPSYAQVSRTDSYERLEFLGDAVLDMMVTELLAEHIDKLTQGRMTQIKAALVNADLLGFLCFRLRSVESHRAIDARSTGTHPTEIRETYERSLADYLDFHPDIVAIHRDSHARYQEMQHAVQQELEHGAFHPWAKLKQLGAHKMFSDMVESILGAMFLDSGQELSACRSFSRRLGLHRYAKRVIDEQVDVTAREAPIDPPEASLMINSIGRNEVSDKIAVQK